MSPKNSEKPKIVFLENNKILSDKSQLGVVFNNYLTYLVWNVDTRRPQTKQLDLDPVSNIFLTFKNYRSIEFVKCRAIGASVIRVGGGLAWVRLVACYRGRHAKVSGIGNIQGNTGVVRYFSNLLLKVTGNEYFSK